nr:cytochrome P450 3A8-like [Dermacentor andersoni]
MSLLGVPGWLLFAVTLCVLLYLYSARKRNYWKEQNVKHEPLSVFAAVKRLLLKPPHIVDVERYKKMGRLFGFFEGGEPILMVAEPDLIKLVLVKDFPNLPDRMPFQFFEPLLDNTVGVTPLETWRRIRPSVSPAFTTGKLRKMTDLIQQCAKKTAIHLTTAAHTQMDVEMQQFYGHYAMDVISRCAFGTEVDSHSDKTNEFVTCVRTVISGGLNLRLLVLMLFPGLMNALRMKVFDPRAFEYLKNFTLAVMKKRENERHEDFLQLMMDAQEGTLSDAGECAPEHNSEVFNLGSDSKCNVLFGARRLTETEAMAQCVQFFLAGLDTTSAVLAYTAYLLALNPDVQNKLRKEVNECIETHGCDPSLDVVSKLKYLHCVLSETLRMYPPAPRLQRIASKEYVLGETGIRLSSGCAVVVPVYAMHHDPLLFPDPEIFNPDRFSEENAGSIQPYTYLPFGAGPRNCVGMRFALLSLKLCLLHSVRSVEFVPTEKTKVPLMFHKGAPVLSAKDVFLGIRKIPSPISERMPH